MNPKTNKFGLRIAALVLVIAALIFGGLGITGVAAQSAIPGDALYPVKTTIEKTRLSLARDAGDRAQMKMRFAEQRLDEIESLVRDGRYREVNQAVLEFESNINSAILELDTLSKTDPARAALLAGEITAALSRYSEALTTLLANVPEIVKSEVNRALQTTSDVSGLDMPSDDDNSNSNVNDDDLNGDDDSNRNANSNDDDDDNSNGNVNSNGNDDDDSDRIGNSNSNSNFNSNSNSNSNSKPNSNSNSNSNSYDDSNSNGDDDSNSNSDDDSNSNSDDDSNSNSDDDGDDD